MPLWLHLVATIAQGRKIHAVMNRQRRSLEIRPKIHFICVDTSMTHLKTPITNCVCLFTFVYAFSVLALSTDIGMGFQDDRFMS